MTIRTMAGLGMTLVAAGLLVIFFLVPRLNDRPSQSTAPTPAALELPPVVEDKTGGPEPVANFLTDFNANYRSLRADREAGRWTAAANTSPENIETSNAAAHKLGSYVGGRAIIEKLSQFRNRTDLTRLQERQLEIAWQMAAHFPGTIPATVDRLLATESSQTVALNTWDYSLPDTGGQLHAVTLREIQIVLAGSKDPAARKSAWEACMQPGPSLKDGLVDMRLLRNAIAREMGYSSYFGLQCADYGLTSEEMIGWLDELVDQLMPLYEQLHCWARHQLAVRYEVKDVPQQLPVHWLPRRWGERWPGMANKIDLDGIFIDYSPQWMIEQAERFCTSLGFDPLPVTFWGRSDLFELSEDDGRVKSAQASAWHMDLDQDVRSLMNIRPGFSWFKTTHGELGRIYNFLAYSRTEVPPILRRGSSRAFPAGLSSLIELAGSQSSYLQEIGLLAAGDAPPQMRILLNQALLGPVVSLPFTCGTLAHWEHDLYEKDLPRHLFNTRWWELAGRFQGITSPDVRNEEYCDPATLPQVTGQPARSYDEALSGLIMHQLHRYICAELLQQDVHAANYHGNKSVGMYLHSILQLGATRSWDQVIRDATGEELSATAMVEYYEPLMEWLQGQNKNREMGFGEES